MVELERSEALLIACAKVMKTIQINLKIMKIAILGTGIVGRSHAGRLAELGHEVVVGTHEVEKTMSKTEKDAMGTPPYSEWQKTYPQVKLMTFAEAVKEGEMIFNALKGEIAGETLMPLMADLKGKILVDIANDLDFSKGMPPTLLVCNTDSLGEQIQNALPEVKVVKAFNTTSAPVQVDPVKLANADHDLFICGNDAEAKAKVTEIAKSYGWKEIIDLGDITNSRGMEMMLPMWVRLWGTLNTAMFNYKIVK